MMQMLVEMRCIESIIINIFIKDKNTIVFWHQITSNSIKRENRCENSIKYMFGK